QVAAVITDPLFYLRAIPAITALGLGKGGFAGVLDPAACAHHAAVAGGGDPAADRAVPGRHLEGAVATAPPERSGRDVLGFARGLHLDHHSGRCAALPGTYLAAAPRQVHADRHDHHLLRARQRDEARTLFCTRPVLAANAGDIGRAPAVRNRHQFFRPLARAQDADRAVLPDHLSADVSDLAGPDLARCQRHSCGSDGVIITSRSRRKRRRLDAAARAWSASMAKITTAAIVVVSVVLCSAAGAFDLQGHRGARGLAPENTLPAFATALSIGVTTLELDLAMTSDGILVVSHDSRLNPDHTRGPDGTFLAAEGPAIRSLTLGELQRYDVGRLKPGTAYAAAFPEQRGMDGVRIPTLMEVFDLVRQAKADHVRFNIETKLTP